MAVGFNHWGQIAAGLQPAISKVVRKTAFDLDANIQGFIRANGQIDTGFMINSVYVRTSQESTYSGGAKALAEVQAPPDDQTAFVGVAALYGIYQNYGTRYIPARPFFEPAVNLTQPEFDAALAKIYPGLSGSIG